MYTFHITFSFVNDKSIPPTSALFITYDPHTLNGTEAFKVSANVRVLGFFALYKIISILI